MCPFATHWIDVQVAISALSKTNRNCRVHMPWQGVCSTRQHAGKTTGANKQQTIVLAKKVSIMMMRIFAYGVATVAFGSLALIEATDSTAFAGEPRQIETYECKEQISFESFQNACKNPAANGWQIRPHQIDVMCTKRELVWLPSRTSVDVNLTTFVDIDVRFGGKKKCVEDRASFQSDIMEKATCFQFEQVERTYSRTIAANCDDLAKFNSAVELCDATLKGAAAGWALIGQNKTDNIVNSCDGQMGDSSKPARPPQVNPKPGEDHTRGGGDEDRTQ